MTQQFLTLVFALSALQAPCTRLRAQPTKASLDQKLSAIALNRQILSTLKANAECSTHSKGPSDQCINLCKKEPDQDCVKACDEVRVLICDPPASASSHVVISDGQSAAVAAAAATAAQQAVREAVQEAQ